MSDRYAFLILLSRVKRILAVKRGDESKFLLRTEYTLRRRLNNRMPSVYIFHHAYLTRSGALDPALAMVPPNPSSEVLREALNTEFRILNRLSKPGSEYVVKVR